MLPYGKDALTMTEPLPWFIFLRDTFYHISSMYFSCLFSYFHLQNWLPASQPSESGGDLKENGVNGLV